MKSKSRYKNQDLVNSAHEAILREIKPGDVINQIGHANWWQLWYIVANRAIRCHQRKLFGKASFLDKFPYPRIYRIQPKYVKIEKK